MVVDSPDHLRESTVHALWYTVLLWVVRDGALKVDAAEGCNAYCHGRLDTHIRQHALEPGFGWSWG